MTHLRSRLSRVVCNSYFLFTPFSSKKIVTILALISLSPSAFAINASGIELESDTNIVVTPNRYAQKKSTNISGITLFTAEDIAKNTATDLPSLLDQVPGLDVTQSGGIGQNVRLKMRGLQTKHIVVLVDGVRTASATTGASALQYIDPQSIDRIEIVRGPLASVYGADAVAGVIQIFTKQADGRSAIGASIGSQGNREARLSGSHVDDYSDLQFSLKRQRADGLNAIDGFNSNPDNDGIDQLSASFGSGYRIGKNRFNVQGHRSSGDNGFDIGASDPAFADDGNTEFVTQQLGVAWQTQWQKNFDSNLAVNTFTDEQETTSAFSSLFKTKRNTATWLNHLEWKNLDLNGGVDYWQDEVSGTVDFVDQQTDNLGVFLQADQNFSGWNLQSSIRHDSNDSYGEYTTFGLGAGIPLSDSVSTVAQYSTAFKAPSFNDLYYPDFGNPDLEVEESKTAELGLQTSIAGGEYEARAFQTDIDQLITFSSTTFTSINLGSVRIRGGELSWQQFLSKNWSLGSNYTYQDPINQETDERLPEFPRHQFNTFVDYNFDKHYFQLAWELTSERLSINTWEFPATTENLSGSGQLHASYRRVWNTWTFGIKARDLLDREAVEVASYRAPGRLLLLSVDYLIE
ncbi:MAG: TonB-dependent receptor [Pseudomonadota bacterium]